MECESFTLDVLKNINSDDAIRVFRIAVGLDPLTPDNSSFISKYSDGYFFTDKNGNIKFLEEHRFDSLFNEFICRIRPIDVLSTAIRSNNIKLFNYIIDKKSETIENMALKIFKKDQYGRIKNLGLFNDLYGDNIINLAMVYGDEDLFYKLTRKFGPAILLFEDSSGLNPIGFAMNKYLTSEDINERKKYLKYICIANNMLKLLDCWPRNLKSIGYKSLDMTESRDTYGEDELKEQFPFFF